MSDPITPLTPADEVADAQAVEHEGLAHRILVQLDILANVIADGVPDMTISSRAAIAAQKGKTWGIGLSRVLNIFEKDHGLKAEQGDVTRAGDLNAILQPNIKENTL